MDIDYLSAKEDYLEQLNSLDSRLVTKDPLYARHWDTTISPDGFIRVFLSETKRTAPTINGPVIITGSREFIFSPDDMLNFFFAHYSHLNCRFYFVHVIAKLDRYIEEQQLYFGDRHSPFFISEYSLGAHEQKAYDIAFHLALKQMLCEAGKVGGYYNGHNPLAFDIARRMSIFCFSSPSTGPAF